MAEPSYRPKIAILISTYNGGRHLATQLESLVAQEGVTLDVFVRDDGSTDDTLEILAGYAHLWPHLATPITGDNLGSALSFLELLRCTPDGFDYYAFCDQDDVWQPDKLYRAAERLGCEDAARPVLYCSSVQCVDDKLNPEGTFSMGSDGRFEHLLFENIAIGNTIVMNPSARLVVNSSPPTSGLVMHDWWCAMVVAARGMLVCDDKPGVLYRQHGGNVVGRAHTIPCQIIALNRLFWKNPRRFYPIHAQAVSFLSLHGDHIDQQHRRLVEALVASRRSFLTRVRFALFGRMVHRRLPSALLARGLIVLGLY